MLYKLISSALLVLVLAQGAVSAPQGGPIELACGGPSDAPSLLRLYDRRRQRLPSGRFAGPLS
ncbi:hypothetical protein C8R44DRAFT_882631 [Mycena epipterygia]|nr:hypothetical protein C8R44DRAFT_882631 [Mycena epipterygia]